MNTRFEKFRNGLLAFLLGALPVTNAFADDIEIYVGGDSDVAGVRPNILFVLDTSGSMGTEVVTQVPYDPAIDYPGECEDGYVYISDDNNPSCDDNNWWDWWWGGNDQAQRIQADKFLCDAATTPLATTGYYQDRFAQWRDHNKVNRRQWNDNVDTEDRLTECAGDEGLHGQTDGSTETYPGNRQHGPFTSSQGDSISWNNYDVYTAYSANYLNWMNDDSSTVVQTRIEIMQDVFKNTLDSVSNVNVGLMRFDRGAEGGMVVHEIANLATARETLKTQIDEMSAAGNTPLSETLYEAAQYYMGRDVDYGRYSRDEYGDRPSVAESRTGWTYNSPMQYQCQKNFIVYLTDGEPTSDYGADSKIENLPGNSENCSGNCMDELAEYLYEKDLHGSLAGKQNVITYTIGFATDQQLLSDAAQKGGGKYYTADDTAGLTSALTNIISEVLAVNTTFTAPAVSVNAFNRTVHLDQLFFTIFKPNERPHWDGNLKRFDLGKENESDTDVQILDKNNQVAVDPNTGFFKDDAVSFWTLSDQSPDGGEAGLGGAAGMIELPRAVYTYTGSSTDLRNDTNSFHEDNTLITKASLAIDGATDQYRTELLQWARGVDIDDIDDDGSMTDGRRRMGDPLHSKPVVVTYGRTAEDETDIVVFMTTNDGFLHAVSGLTGEEYFAFIPQELWNNLDTLYQNNAGTDSKVYGLDSPVTAWIKDVDNDGTVEPADGDHVYLYFGQRRGGKNYYAIDVTDRTAPEFMWQVNDSELPELAQSWSPPRHARVKIGAAEKDVLIFGGGYDEDQDQADSYVEDDEGRAVFMVDAATGDLLWWAGPSGSGANLELADLQNSIPAEVRVVDMNTDGLADRMYVGDLGGRIFRFDIINGESAANLVKGGMIAALGAGELASPTTADNRKFFYPPDAALIVGDDARYINLAIGSGNQDHPLGKINQDRFYSIRDWNVYNVPATYDVVTPADLHDATENLVQEGDDGERSAALEELNSRDGWWIDLENVATGANEGEKVLAEAVTIQGNIFFTTFTPVASTQTDSCAPSQGIARVYQVSARMATPVENYNGIGDDDNLTREDRAMDLVRGGIPPEVTILFPESRDGQPLGLVGPERIPLNMTNAPVRTYWYEVDGQN